MRTFGSRRDLRRDTQSGSTSLVLEATGLCGKCGALVIREQIYKGWCLPCVQSWANTADPWVIYQAQSHLPRQIIAKTTISQIDQLQERLVGVKDDDLLPLMQFHGSRSLAQQRSMWNVLQAMYVFEIETTSELLRLGALYPNTTHLCGRHAPVQRSGFQGFISRIESAGSDFKLRRDDTDFRDYLNWFVHENRVAMFSYKKTSVDVYGQEKTRRFVAKYGKTHLDKHQPVYWPFEGDYDGKLRERGALEELPDYVMQIGALIPTRMPATLREDLCQDLVVAVLTNEISLDEMKIESRMRHYIRHAFETHPLRYGRYSLDSVLGDDEDQRARSEWVTDEDTAPARADRGWLADVCVDPDAHAHGWHDGMDREKGLATLGDIARHGNDGYAIDGPDVIVRQPEDVDAEIREVFEMDQHPAWRRRLSD